MNVIWNTWAEEEMLQTADYIETQYGENAKEKFFEEVFHIAELLGKNPHLGKVEPLLATAPVMYRSIVVNRLNKIIYYVNGNVIEIVDFWDTRREPRAQAVQVK